MAPFDGSGALPDARACYPCRRDDASAIIVSADFHVSPRDRRPAPAGLVSYETIEALAGLTSKGAAALAAVEVSR